MSPFTSMLMPNPEIQKLSIFIDSAYREREQYYGEELIDLKDAFYFNKTSDRTDFIKEHIVSLNNSINIDSKISENVINNTNSILDELYPSIVEELDINNITTTTYGTIVMDWEKDIDNVFSLEIGLDEIGYFIEKNGIDLKQVDSIILEDSVKRILLQDLSSFLID